MISIKHFNHLMTVVQLSNFSASIDSVLNFPWHSLDFEASWKDSAAEARKHLRQTGFLLIPSHHRMALQDLSNPGYCHKLALSGS